MNTDDDPDLSKNKKSRGILKATIKIGWLTQARLDTFSQLLSSHIQKEGNHNMVNGGTVMYDHFA